MEATNTWIEIDKAAALTLGAIGRLEHDYEVDRDGTRFWNDGSHHVLVARRHRADDGVDRYSWQMVTPSLSGLLDITGGNLESRMADVVDLLGFGVKREWHATSGVCLNGCGRFDPDCLGSWYEVDAEMAPLLGQPAPRPPLYCAACRAKFAWLDAQPQPEVKLDGRTYRLQFRDYRLVEVWGALEHRHPQHVVFNLDEVRWGLGGPQMRGKRNTRERRLYAAAWALIEPLLGDIPVPDAAAS